VYADNRIELRYDLLTLMSTAPTPGQLIPPWSQLVASPTRTAYSMFQWAKQDAMSVIETLMADKEFPASACDSCNRFDQEVKGTAC
jgi:hypothetical protein